MTEPPGLICDAMLGRLARKLRLAGVDTVYHRGSDDEFVAIAVTRHRIPVTRDLQLSRRKIFTRLNLTPIVPASSDYHIQFNQVINELKKRGYRLDRLSVRCPECNLKLVAVVRFSTARHVPAYVFLNREEFSLCAGCFRVFWKGTHHAHFTSDLNLEEVVKPGKDDVSHQHI